MESVKKNYDIANDFKLNSVIEKKNWSDIAQVGSKN